MTCTKYTNVFVIATIIIHDIFTLLILPSLQLMNDSSSQQTSAFGQLWSRIESWSIDPQPPPVKFDPLVIERAKAIFASADLKSLDDTLLDACRNLANGQNEYHLYVGQFCESQRHQTRDSQPTLLSFLLSVGAS